MKTTKKLLTILTVLFSTQAIAKRVCFQMPFGGPHCINIPDTPPAKQCASLHEHPNFGGAGWAINAETEAADMSGGMIERRRWRGTLRGYTGKDRSWNDAVSSIVVKPGCVLSIWTAANFGEQLHKYEGLAGAEHRIGQVSQNDQYSSFKCTCEETKIPGGLFLAAPMP